MEPIPSRSGSVAALACIGDKNKIHPARRHKISRLFILNSVLSAQHLAVNNLLYAIICYNS